MNNHSTFNELIKTYIIPQSNVEVWSEDHLEEYRHQSLGNILQHAYQNNAFYRQKMVERTISPEDFDGVESFQKFPFTYKDELRGKPWLLLSVPKKRLSQIHVSTGTTEGEPLFILYTKEDLYRFDLSPKHKTLMPIKSDDVVINTLPYEMSSAGLSFHRVFQHGEDAIVIPTGKGGFYSLPDKTVEIMKWLSSTILITTPSYAMYLWEVAKSMGIEANKEIPLKRMWITGEGCSNSFRKRLEEKWGCKAYFYYGSLECGPLGIECDEQNGYHIPHAHVYLEIIDPQTSEPLAPGQIGEIVVTTLLREGAPIIRYYTGDIGFVEDLPCPCGVTMQRLFLRGRKEDQIILKEGEYSPIYMEEFLMKIPEIGDWFLFVVKDKRLSIQIEKSYGIELDDETLKEKVKSQFEFGCGVCPADVEIVEKLLRPRGKTIRVINKDKGK